MTKFTATFEFSKETKHTCKYEETPEAGQPPRIGSLYVQKWAFGGGAAPSRLSVSVEEAASDK